jgi:hypothetical protein
MEDEPQNAYFPPDAGFEEAIVDTRMKNPNESSVFIPMYHSPVCCRLYAAALSIMPVVTRAFRYVYTSLVL